MKYTNRSLCALFAAPKPRVTTARTASMFFEGDSLYSYGYHYLLAYLQVKPDGTKNAWINNTKYSMTTTSYHRSMAISELLKAGWGILHTNNPAAIRDGHNGN